MREQFGLYLSGKILYLCSCAFGRMASEVGAAHEKRTGADLVLDGSQGCAVFCCFRCLRDAVVEIGFKLTG